MSSQSWGVEVPHSQAKEGRSLPVPLAHPALPWCTPHTCLFSLSPCPTDHGPQGRRPNEDGSEYSTDT